MLPPSKATWTTSFSCQIEDWTDRSGCKEFRSFGWPFLAAQMGQLLQKSEETVKWELLQKSQRAGKQVSITPYRCTAVLLHGIEDRAGEDRAVNVSIHQKNL